MSSAEAMSTIRRTDAIFIILLVATAITFAVGGLGWAPAHAWGVPLVLALVLLKGVLIAQDFMELRHAPALWRRFRPTFQDNTSRCRCCPATASPSWSGCCPASSRGSYSSPA